MKKLNKIFHFKIVLSLLILSFVSCSKDSDNPDPAEISVTASDFSVTMDENPANGQVIGTFQGSTNQGTVSFSIIEQNPAGAFSIDAASGQLKVANATLFDFEINPTITGTVKVANGVISKNALVTVTLNDVNEENVYEGNIWLKSQAELNSFAANNYTRINGNLVIGSDVSPDLSDITDLRPLSSIKYVRDSFSIINNGQLTIVEGFENLTHIGHHFQFVDNPLLTSIKDLKNITSINGTFWIFKCKVLTNFDGISNLSSVGEHFLLSNNYLMTNLDWMSNMVSINGTLDISSCNDLSDITGLQNLQNLNGLSVTSTKIQNLDVFQNLTTFVNILSIGNNDLLTSIEGLQNFSATKSVAISGNDLLTNLKGLERVINLSEELIISGNNSLTDLEGLNNLVSVLTLIRIRENNNLTNLSGLENLNEIFELRITNNPILIDFCALQNLCINGTLGSFYASLNAYNPTKQDIIDGNCSL